MRLGPLTNDSTSPDTVGIGFDWRGVNDVHIVGTMRLEVYLLHGSGSSVNFYFALLSTEQSKS